MATRAKTFDYTVNVGLAGPMSADGSALAPDAAWTPEHLVLAGLAPAFAVFVAACRPDVVLTRRALVTVAAGVLVLSGAVAFVPPLSADAYRVWVGPPGIAEYFRLTLPVRPMLRELGYYLLYLGYQFPSVTLPLGLIGIAAVLRDRPRQAFLLLGAALVNAGVFIHHTAWGSGATAKFVFYISDYAVFALCCAVGADELLRVARSSLSPALARGAGIAMLALAVLVPPVFYAVLPGVLSTYGIDLVRAKAMPYRDSQQYFLNPNKHGYRGARRFAEEALRAVPPSAVIFADYTPATVLRYVQLVERVRPDVRLVVADGRVDDRVHVSWTEAGGVRRPTFVATLIADYYDFSGLRGEYDLVPVGPIFEVRPRE